ncbi:MAG: hypothetical protein ABIN48_11880 [Ginsengibacter sp.]
MEQKLPTDIFNTQRWFDKDITDPYQVVAEFFSHAEVYHFRSVIKKLLFYAESDKIYKGKPPADVYLYMRIIDSLIRAAYVLKDKKKGSVKVLKVDVFNKKYYCSHYKFSNEWTDFPRSLALEEFCNPYQVFRKFFKYQDLEKWIRDLELITDTALTPARGCLMLDRLVTYFHLVKLIEAAHLIDVREVTHIGETLKNRSLIKL